MSTGTGTGAGAPDEVSRHALPMTIGSVAVGLGLLLLAGGIGLVAGPTGLLARLGYAGGGVALVGFGWVFLVRSLVELVRIGASRADRTGEANGDGSESETESETA